MDPDSYTEHSAYGERNTFRGTKRMDGNMIPWPDSQPPQMTEGKTQVDGSLFVGFEPLEDDCNAGLEVQASAVVSGTLLASTLGTDHS